MIDGVIEYIILKFQKNQSHIAKRQNKADT
ncbi:MAG: hypothetical protein ACJA1Z_002133 [Patiriisocius sp.]|jgi:hypothetical protein